MASLVYLQHFMPFKHPWLLSLLLPFWLSTMSSDLACLPPLCPVLFVSRSSCNTCHMQWIHHIYMSIVQHGTVTNLWSHILLLVPLPNLVTLIVRIQSVLKYYWLVKCSPHRIQTTTILIPFPLTTMENLQLFYFFCLCFNIKTRSNFEAPPFLWPLTLASKRNNVTTPQPPENSSYFHKYSIWMGNAPWYEV